MFYYKENSFYKYKDGELFADGLSVKRLAEEYGTPLFIYSAGYLKEQAGRFSSAFSLLPHRVFYAVKANNNISIIRQMKSCGFGMDVNSAGELYKALQAGVEPQSIIFAGVGKTAEEIEYALKNKILLLKAECREEVELIQSTAKRLNTIARIALRVNPDVDAKTHPYISTGLSGNKFGMPLEEAGSVYTSEAYPDVSFTGIDMHLGSQIKGIEPYIEAAEKVAAFVSGLSAQGVRLHHLDMGGGFGIDYGDDNTINIEELAGRLKPIVEPLQIELFFEPGRFFTANSGLLATKVLYNKMNRDKKFIIVDGAMTELIRPALYQAYHHIQPVVRRAGEKTNKFDVVGPVCESSDYFGKERELPTASHGDYLAIMSAGAYGSVMASNYNARLHPAEILVDGDKVTVIRKRDALEDLIRGES